MGQCGFGKGGGSCEESGKGVMACRKPEARLVLYSRFENLMDLIIS